MRWVQENVASFGGNPDQVTISGQSAGASSVELHLVSKNIEVLFHGAICQSVARLPLPTPDQQEVNTDLFSLECHLAEQLQQPLFNFYSSRAGCGTGSIQTQLACLRQASVSALAVAQDAVANTSIL